MPLFQRTNSPLYCSGPAARSTTAGRGPLYHGGPGPALRLPSREDGSDGGGWEGKPTAIATGQLA
ncbi:hypothetical protein EGJ24_04585 [Stenotrophomonas maltophilia]|nr:hypothetical protein EGJ24_04585 [Stenotrophomonas maltophilia]